MGTGSIWTFFGGEEGSAHHMWKPTQVISELTSLLWWSVFSEGNIIALLSPLPPRFSGSHHTPRKYYISRGNEMEDLPEMNIGRGGGEGTHGSLRTEVMKSWSRNCSNMVAQNYNNNNNSKSG